MSQKLLFIFNPHAGKGQIKNHLVDIVDMMVKAGFDVTIYTTQAQADATRKVVEEGAPPSFISYISPVYSAYCASNSSNKKSWYKR